MCIYENVKFVCVSVYQCLYSMLGVCVWEFRVQMYAGRVVEQSISMSQYISALGVFLLCVQYVPYVCVCTHYVCGSTVCVWFYSVCVYTLCVWFYIVCVCTHYVCGSTVCVCVHTLCVVLHCVCVYSIYSISVSSMLKLDLRLESTEASGDMAESRGSPPRGDRGSSIIRKPRSPLLPWVPRPPSSPSPDRPSGKPGTPSHKSSDWAKSKG